MPVKSPHLDLQLTRSLRRSAFALSGRRLDAAPRSLNMAHHRERYPHDAAIDFREFDLQTLHKYIDYFPIHVSTSVGLQETAVAVARHFESVYEVDEVDVLNRFMNVVRRGGVDGESSLGRRTAKRTGDRRVSAAKRRKDRDSDAASQEDDDSTDQPVWCICRRVDFGEMIGCDNDNCEIEWFHLECVGLTPDTRPGENQEWFCPTCQQLQAQNGRKGRARASAAGGRDSGPAYAEMIEVALRKLPDQQGTIKQISDIIAQDYKDMLNWKSESTSRKAPVWRASVRKTLLGSPSKFEKRGNNFVLIER